MTESKITVKQQVAGFHRQRVGQFLVTTLYDGYINLAPTLFHGLADYEINRLIDRKFQPRTAEGVPTAVTTYLIKRGSDLTLLNAGGAGPWADLRTASRRPVIPRKTYRPHS